MFFQARCSSSLRHLVQHKQKKKKKKKKKKKALKGLILVFFVFVWNQVANRATASGLEKHTPASSQRGP